jgi:hypothetical protein
METRKSGHDVGNERLRSPTAAAAILLGIYVAMHLAVGGVIHVLTPPDAVAAAPDNPMARPSAATASNPVGGAAESPPDVLPGQASERAGGTPECRPGAASGSNCMSM